jgi:6-phospho-beta-glucosidase
MEELCPDAWLVNFTNPAGIITEAALNHSSIKTLGLCNNSIGMQNGIASNYGCNAKDVYIDFIGLNHLIWARNIYVNGKDKTKEIVAKAHEHDEVMQNIPDISMGAAFYESIGMLPVSYLKYFYMTKEMYEECIRQAENKGTRGEVVKKLEADLFELYKDENLKVKPEQLSKRGGAHYSDAACNLINSIYNDKRDLHVVCVKNNGAYPELPDDAVVERNCIVGINGATPLAVGNLPLQVRGLIQLVKAYEQLTVKAGVFGDRSAAIQALTIHPLIPSSTVALELLDDIIKSNIDYLPQF